MTSIARSPSRGRERTRSLTPVSRQHSPRRSVTPRSPRSQRSRSRDDVRRSRSLTRSRSPAPKSTKIVVEKLTKNVNEDHLREIFGQYGQIRDMDLPLNRQFGTNRGTAYILYTLEADAEAAIAHMHESQLDGATINVSIVLPRRKFSPSPPTSRRPGNLDPRGGRGPMPPQRRRSPPRDFGRGGGRGGNPDAYRPRSLSRSRSRSPRRSRSGSYSSRSRSPPRRRGGHGGRRDSMGRNGNRRRSPSYSSYSSRSRSRSRDRASTRRR